MVSILAFTLLAQQRSLTFDTTLKSVAVFRDGYGYFVREGQVKLEEGWATTTFLPSAIRGTVWVYPLDKADHIDTVITTRENKLDFANVDELKAKLGDKKGLHLIVTTRNGQKFEGDLARLLDDMLLLQVGAGFSAVPFGQVASVSLPGYPIKVKVDCKDPQKLCRIGIAYLQEGIRWEPSYVLNLEGGKADLELRASMQNTTESLSKSDVLFVVGSPFVANRGIQDMMGLVPAGAQSATVTGAPVSDPDKKTAETEHVAVPMPEKAAISGEEAGELYFYKKPDLSLATNDIAMVSIFHSTVPITPTFEWNADGEEVVYLLNLKNNTAQPLTTGPVLVVEDGKAIGQETVKYTPAGGDAEIRLSRGIGMRVEKTEAEAKRGTTVHIGKSDFVPVSMKGTLRITNFRSSVAPVKVMKTVRGRVVSQSDGGEVKNTQVLSGEVNPINDLEWKVNVGPGETKTITYAFDTYMFADRSGTPPVPATGDGG